MLKSTACCVSMVPLVAGASTGPAAATLTGHLDGLAMESRQLVVLCGFCFYLLFAGGKSGVRVLSSALTLRSRVTLPVLLTAPLSQLSQIAMLVRGVRV